MSYRENVLAAIVGFWLVSLAFNGIKDKKTKSKRAKFLFLKFINIPNFFEIISYMIVFLGIIRHF
jgi:hypothetical protein